MIEIYGDEKSGNCLKVKWLCDYLGAPYRWHALDVLKGETRTAAFLAINPAGQIPCVRLADGRSLAQSNAILTYLADKTRLLPTDTYDRAEVLAWMFWEQYSHEPYIAVRRFKMAYLGLTEAEIDPAILDKGTAALRRLDDHLTGRDWLVGDTMTIADICLFPYTALAPEGGFDLELFPQVTRWIRTATDELATIT